MYMRAEHFILEDAPAENRWTIGGYYTVDLTRIGERLENPRDGSARDVADRQP